MGLGGEAAGETEEEEEEVGGGSKGGGGEGGGKREREKEELAEEKKRIQAMHTLVCAYQNVEGDAVTRDGAAEVVDGLAVLCMLHAEASRLGASA